MTFKECMDLKINDLVISNKVIHLAQDINLLAYTPVNVTSKFKESASTIGIYTNGNYYIVNFSDFYPYTWYLKGIGPFSKEVES